MVLIRFVWVFGFSLSLVYLGKKVMELLVSAPFHCYELPHLRCGRKKAGSARPFANYLLPTLLRVLTLSPAADEQSSLRPADVLLQLLGHHGPGGAVRSPVAASSFQ